MKNADKKHIGAGAQGKGDGSGAMAGFDEDLLPRTWFSQGVRDRSKMASALADKGFLVASCRDQRAAATHASGMNVGMLFRNAQVHHSADRAASSAAATAIAVAAVSGRPYTDGACHKATETMETLALLCGHIR
ncbi:hypothetical protein [Shinella zoogloeoides]